MKGRLAAEFAVPRPDSDLIWGQSGRPRKWIFTLSRSVDFVWIITFGSCISDDESLTCDRSNSTLCLFVVLNQPQNADGAVASDTNAGQRLVIWGTDVNVGMCKEKFQV